ncbi:LCCL domain-containing protein [Psychromarinibacter sp. C21-152]|uniref:LCCL domain-containing protein n=1 Tax=Psychromarinibacter sediminicola TaxID=3033385 RepID=A0AAE3T921_9RHOB|nr:LCCL domain-containing protein [Psychromarinibacter sediminicola]MDF0602030.1 LCCL domain-containing protein [Psychromarinibacter sediminicola]
MDFRIVAVVLAMAVAPGAGLAQGKGGQAGQAGPAEDPAADLPACAPLPADVDSMACACPPPGAFAGSVWGSNPYTADSDICTAARHAGAIGAEGGEIRLERLPGQAAYEGSTANGVTTEDYGRYDESIGIAALETAPAPTPAPTPTPTPVPAVDPADLPECDGLPEAGGELACRCGAGPHRGAVWGSGPYTGDSDICTAARHAGAIGPEGGALRLLHRPGQDGYDGSEANGIETRDWGSYSVSFDVIPFAGARKAEVADSTPPPPPETTAEVVPEPAPEAEPLDEPGAEVALPDCTVMPDGAEAHACTCGRTSARGDVWGMGPYTADSDLCTAARHAGVIRAFGGEIRVLRIRGLDRYAGGVANGVRTSDWAEPFDSSIVFDRN